MKIVRLKATLDEIRPPIWRRLEVPAGLSLQGLHQVLQAAFGWTDSHLHEFEVAGIELSPPDPDGELETLDSRKQPLADFEGRVQGLVYVYDFGDYWKHLIVIESWAEAEPGLSYPRCLAGERACPPEDCGSTPGYDELLAALADPEHEEHEAMKQWLGEPWDPEAFNLSETNIVLQHLRLPKSKISPGPWAKALRRGA